MKSVIEIGIQSYSLKWPNAPYEWLERAAKESFHWAGRNPSPTLQQIETHLARIEKMCTTGEW